jgi:hypothetical protein
MVVFTENGGYFEQGVWFKGKVHHSMVGKKLVRTCPCMCPYGSDYSYSVVGKFEPKCADTEWVILREINIDGSLVIEWNPRAFSGETNLLEPHWNDGNWIEYKLSNEVK